VANEGRELEHVDAACYAHAGERGRSGDHQRGRLVVGGDERLRKRER
jgi:hypothetical protein